MAGQIDLSGVFAAAFGPVYGDGVLHRVTVATTAGRRVPTVIATVAIKVQIDNVSDAVRAAGLYGAEEQRLLVLRSGVGAPPTLADNITAGGKRWAIASIDSDPAQTHWAIRAKPA